MEQWKPELKDEAPLDATKTTEERGSDLLTNTKEVRVRSGAQSYRVNVDGMFLGAEQIENAPFAVYPDGSFRASSGTISGNISGANISGGTITTSNLIRNDFQWFTLFESTEGYSKYVDTASGGQLTTGGENLIVSCGTTATANQTYIKKQISTSSVTDFTWDKTRRFKTIVQLDGMSDQLIRFGMGEVGAGDNNQIGFKLQDTTLYSQSGNGGVGGTHSLLTGISAGTVMTLEAKLTPGTKIDYSINGTLVYSETNTAIIPTGEVYAQKIFYTSIIPDNSGTTRAIRIGYWDFWQSTS
jgi:hypothetical protein